MTTNVESYLFGIQIALHSNINFCLIVDLQSGYGNS